MPRPFLLFLIFAASLPAPGAAPCDRHFAELRGYYELRRPIGPDRYPMDAEANFSYDQSFRHMLGNRTFAEWLRERRAAGRSNHVADFFGSGVFLRDLSSVDSITGVRLRPKVVPGMVPGYPNERWAEVAGNLFERETWNRVRANMRERDIPAYDLIVSRPIGPLALSSADAKNPAKLRPYLTAHFNLLNRAYGLLSPNDGMLLVEVPYTVSQTTQFRNWLRALEREGFDFEFRPENILGFTPKTPQDLEISSGALRIRRAPTSPDRLPPF